MDFFIVAAVCAIGLILPIALAFVERGRRHRPRGR
ncbi:hypothetical protein JOD63_002478 [Microbacterium terrae]|nr:hypothetical protein [Microbacterium terrae]